MPDKDHLFTSEKAREAQKKSVESRMKNRERRAMDFEARLQGMDNDSLELLYTQINDSKLDPKIRQQAATYIIDRIHGRPTQHTEADIHDTTAIETARQHAREKLAQLLGED